MNKEEYCTNCGAKIDKNEQVCPICNHIKAKTTTTSTPVPIQMSLSMLRNNKNIKIIMATAAICFVALIVCTFISFSGNNKVSTSTKVLSENLIQEESSLETPVAKTEEEITQESEDVEEQSSVVQVAENTEDAEKERYELCIGDYTWDEASELAKVYGGHLATITTEEEEDTLETMLNSNESYVEHVWLGGTNLSGSYEWITGEENIYGHCHNGEPNNDGGNEHYLALTLWGDGWGWSDSPNNVNNMYSGVIGFIVEYED